MKYLRAIINSDTHAQAPVYKRDFQVQNSKGQDIIIKGLKIGYRMHIQVDELNYFWRRIERALANLGSLTQKEQRHRKLYARNDDQANFEKDEMIAWEQDAADLIEI